MENKERFLELCSKVQRPGMDSFLKWLESSDFYIAPASTKFHGNYPGGLLEHSLNVYDELQRLLKAYPEITCSEETAIVISLLHDICKVNMYVSEKRNRKNEFGQWETYDAYTRQEKFCYGGHGSKSVFIVQNYFPLAPEEAVAINCHMGAYSENPESIGSAYNSFPLAWILHVADEGATYIKENENAIKN